MFESRSKEPLIRPQCAGRPPIMPLWSERLRQKWPLIRKVAGHCLDFRALFQPILFYRTMLRCALEYGPNRGHLSLRTASQTEFENVSSAFCCVCNWATRKKNLLQHPQTLVRIPLWISMMHLAKMSICTWSWNNEKYSQKMNIAGRLPE